MNYYAYRTTGLAIKTLTDLSKAVVRLHGVENIPRGANIFVINHFTRIETLLLPYYIYKQTGVPVWSLASAVFFRGALADLLELVGAVSTENPHRDRLIVKTLLTAEAAWIIFPEGRMVKDKKIMERGRFMISTPDGKKRRPHTGAASLGLRTEFYRQRMAKMLKKSPGEAERLKQLFGITDLEPVFKTRTSIVPVNVTYHPLRARENVLSALAKRFVDGIEAAAVDELMTEGSMLLSGVDIDIRFGKAIDLRKRLDAEIVKKDIRSEREINFDDSIPSRIVMRKIAYEVMHDYMSKIYGMTTVNHDHLFASVLKQYPLRKIKEADLKRRVYCVLMQGMQGKRVCFHSSLQNDQISLLTDDRHKKYSDFISLAIEKNTVIRKNETLIKTPDVFSRPFDFHRFRIDNPVGVIANEVETLKILQRSICLYAWTPGFWLRRKLAKHLQKEALEEFKKDHDEFYVEEIPRKRFAGKPFLMRGSFRRRGVLLIHGYLAAPEEVRALARYLRKRGFWVYAPRLRGHGTSPEDLSRRTFDDWRASIDRGYAVIKSLCDKVVVGGFSTGAALALDLASRLRGVEDAEGVFSICSPMRIKFLSSKFASVMDAWNRLLKKIRIENNHVEFIEFTPENPDIKYARNPITGVREVERLMDSLEPRLAELKIPALVIQPLNDPLLDNEAAMRLFKLLGSEEKSYLMFDMDRHVIVGGQGAQKVHKAVGDFVESAMEKKF